MEHRQMQYAGIVNRQTKKKLILTISFILLHTIITGVTSIQEIKERNIISVSKM